MRIARPCTENLDSMPRTAGGGFACSRCEKEVVDLRRMTRKRALAVLADRREAGGSVCARVRATPDGTPLFRPEPSRFAGLLGPVAVATTLAACSPSVSGPRAATPTTLAHADTSGDNRNGTGVPISQSTPTSTPSVVPVASPGSVNVATPIPDVEMAGEMAF